MQHICQNVFQSFWKDFSLMWVGIVFNWPYYAFFFFPPEAEEAKRSKSTFEPLFTISLLLPLWFRVYGSDLPCIVTCPPQSPARCCPPWSFSAWWLSWESLPLFGSCTRSTVLAPASSLRSSTTLRSESWKRTGPAWWRLRRLTVCHRRTFSLFHSRKHLALLTGWCGFMQR